MAVPAQCCGILAWHNHSCNKSKSFRSLTNGSGRSRISCRPPSFVCCPTVDQQLQEAMMLLAGDIGGTKTVLAVFSPKAGPHTPLAEATFPSGRYGRLEAI